MPVYLLHGFRWHRAAIRIHVIVHNIDDAAPEWLIAPGSSEAVIDDFADSWPALMRALPELRLVEQYDPTDERTSFQPYAYVADEVHEVRLGADVGAVMARRGDDAAADAALAQLRDEICMGIGGEERLSWYVVVCGDEEREWDRDEGSDDTPTEQGEEVPTERQPAHPPSEREARVGGGGGDSQLGGDDERATSSPPPSERRTGRDDQPSQRSRSRSLSRGLRMLFRRHGGDLRKSESVTSLRPPRSASGSPSSHEAGPPIPPLPGTAK